jgi:hypothetical protein
MAIVHTENESFFEKEISPYLQLSVVLGFVVIFQFIVYIFNNRNSTLFVPSTHYTVSLAFSLFYIIFNAILSLSTQNQNAYWGKSITGYFLICALGLGIAYLFSGMTIDEAGPYRWIYAVFTFCYIMLLAIIRSMRKIVSIAQKQDHRFRGE